MRIRYATGVEDVVAFHRHRCERMIRRRCLGEGRRGPRGEHVLEITADSLIERTDAGE